MAQNKISRRSFLRGAGASATIAAASCMAPSAAACDIKSLWSMDLQILATSDTHGKFDPWDYAANKADASGSVAQQATAIKQCRTRNTLVVDAGDTIQANSAELFLNDDVHPMIAAQNAIGYDVYVTGNHEWAAHAVQELEPLLEENGVHVLSNTYVMLERGGDRIALLGAEDSNGYADQKTIAELSEEVRQEQGDVYKILLSHRNTRIEEYVDAHIDLTLCGHAHGGLIRLPGTDGLIGPHREFFPSYTAGLYDLPYGQLVASRGLGNQFPAFRLFNRPDVPVVVLE